MTRKNLPKAQRRAATVDAVIALAAITNPAKITTALIAARMGVTQGALFRHFADKQEIWTAVMARTADELLGRFDKIEATHPIDKLEAMFDAHIDFVVTYPGVPRILFGELQRSGKTPAKTRVTALMAEYRSRLVELLEAASADNLISRHTDIPAAATLFLGIIQGLVMQAMIADDFASIRATSAALFPVYTKGIGARS